MKQRKGKKSKDKKNLQKWPSPMRIRTIRRTLIPQHIEQFSRTGGWVNFQYLPGIKFMRASTEPLLCLSTNSTVREKNHCTNFHSFYPLPVIHLQVFLPFLWENQRGGKKKKKSSLDGK